MKTKPIVVGTGVCGVLAGFLLSANIGKNYLVKIATVATLLTAPIGIVAHSIGEGKGNSRANDLEDKLSKKELDAGCTQNELKAALEKISKLGSDLKAIQQNLKNLTLERDAYRNIADSSKPTVEKLQKDLEKSLKAIGNWESKCAELQQKCEDWESSFEIELEELAEKEVQRRLHEIRLSEIKQVCAENDAVTDEAMALMRRMRAWSQKLVQKHDSQKEFVHQLTDAYNGNLDKVIGKIDDINQSFDKERDGYLTQIDCLNQRIALLQREVEGDLVEPEYGQFGFNDDARIAEAIQRRIWDFLKIPLSAKGFRINSDGSAEAGYGYGRSTPLEALIRDLNTFSKSWVKELGIHSIYSIKKYDLCDILVISWRRYPLAKTSDVERFITPLDKFAAKVTTAMTKKGTVRVMGSTGDGKGVVSRFLISKIVETQNWYIRLHDPKHGSDEDYWGIPKVSKSGAEMKKSLKAISKQLEERDKTKITKPVTLDVLDEIDNQLDKTDREQFLELVGQIRHNGMKLFLIGQNPGVGRVGFQWDDMGQMICLYQKSASLTAIEKLKQLKPQKDKLAKQYEMIAEYCEHLNAYLPDEKQYLFGLCVIPDEKPFWYVLPSPDSIEIDRDTNLLGESFSIPNSLSEFVEVKNLSIKQCPSAQTNSIPNEQDTSKTLVNQELQPSAQTPNYGGSTAQAAQAAQTALPTCKRHPVAKLRECKDGRPYCPSCRKKLSQAELEIR